ncbi:NUDIX hydrolase [Candidatus Saccharibacteria bacterium]|nr:NUDIX hydrolase [Candidatus Saccharibacteria bacterium]
MLNCVFEDGAQVLLRHVTADTIIIKDGKILLVKRTGKLLESGKWALAGGFMDRDETIAEAATREVMEETGWKIKDLTLLRINDRPNRPMEDRQNIEFVHFATAIEKIGKADAESSEQKWFDLDKLPPAEEIAFDHADNIELYKKYLKTPFGLPVIG